MNVLLTGGAGFIGSHVAVELLTAGHSVTVADCFYNSSPLVLKNIERITGKDVALHNADIRDADFLNRLFESGAFDGVIHCAGYKSPAESVALPLKYYANNIDSTLVLLDTMERHGVNNLIFSSSATVYGVPKRLPVTEETELSPCANPYGRTKAMIEQIILDMCAANAGLSAVLLRYFNPAGAHESGLIGENPSGEPNNLMPYVAQTAAGIREAVNVYGNDYDTKDGTGIRDYIHVVDLARAHVKALEYAVSRTGADIFNICTGTGYSVMDVIAAFERACGRRIEYRVRPRRAGDIATSYADAGKAKRLLGWVAEKSLDDMCKDAWRWQVGLSEEDSV